MKRLNRIGPKLVAAVAAILAFQTGVQCCLDYWDDADLLWKEFVRQGKLHALGLARAAEYGLLTRNKGELRRVAEMSWTPDDVSLLYVAFYDESGALVTFKDWSGGAARVPQRQRSVTRASMGEPEHTGGAHYDFHAPVLVSREVMGEEAPAPSHGRADAAKAEYAMVMTRRSTDRLTGRIAVEQRGMLVINGAVFVAASLALSFFAYRLLKPIRTLVRGTERVAAGDFVTSVDVGRRRDELRALADSFNRMTGQLREQRDEILSHSRQLEHKVLERTAELAQANVDLQAELAERNRAERALQKRTDELIRSNAELEHFVFVASHDLQEPLRTVMGYAQLLGRRYRGRLDADADEFIEFLVGGAGRMSTLINDLLAYSRVLRRDKALEPTDCDAVLDEVLADLRAGIGETGAEVTRGPLPTLMVDRVQLACVFQNLIGNGLKFHGGEPPRIHVSADRADGLWTFAVRDNGIGIDPQYYERIFVVFKRLHTREQYEGTGIGLAIAKRIIQRHGGRIWVESQPGKGSTFYFTIPAIKDADHDYACEHETRGSAVG